MSHIGLTLTTSDATRHRRVLHVITHLALGGAERVAFTIMRGLREYFDFGLYAANGVDSGDVGQSMKRELEEMSISLHVDTRVPMKLGGMLMAGWGCGHAVERYHPDLQTSFTSTRRFPNSATP